MITQGRSLSRLTKVPQRDNRIIKAFPLRDINWDFRRYPDDDTCLVDVDSFELKKYLLYLMHPRTKL